MFIIGIDVSKATLDAALLDTTTGKMRLHPKVPNSTLGVATLGQWAREKSGLSSNEICVMMEATARYHEVAAELFHGARFAVYVLNPKRVKRGSEGGGLLQKTDKHDARKIALYGERFFRKLHRWEPPPPEIYMLRELVRRLSKVSLDLRRDDTRRTHQTPDRIPEPIKLSYQRVRLSLLSERRELRKAIEAHYEAHPHLQAHRELLNTIPAVGDLCTDHLLCVLLGRHFASAREVAALLGLIPIHTDSGTSVHRPAHLSGEGDVDCCRVLYMNALVAIRPNSKTGLPGNVQLFAIYERLCQGGERRRSKKAALLALVRHVVHIAFGVIRNQMPYNPELVSNVSMERRREILQQAALAKLSAESGMREAA